MTKMSWIRKHKVFFLSSASIISTIIISELSRKKIADLNRTPSIQQYLNRLIEFSDSESLDKFEDQFLTMVDFGSSLSDAFDTVVSQAQESDSF
jgi:hypothetical protein